MALASKIPTQIGRTAELAGSRRIIIGMLVIGSIINPLIFISSSMHPSFPAPPPSLYSVLLRSSQAAGLETGSPLREWGWARLIRTSTRVPRVDEAEGKWTILLQVVLPLRVPGSSRLCP